MPLCTNYRMAYTCTDFRNGKRGSIRSKNAVFFLHNILQFLECLFLNIHHFQSCLDNQITIRTNILLVQEQWVPVLRRHLHRQRGMKYVFVTLTKSLLTSTNFITGAGLKKCIPITGWLIPAPISVMEREV